MKVKMKAFLITLSIMVGVAGSVFALVSILVFLLQDPPLFYGLIAASSTGVIFRAIYLQILDYKLQELENEN